MEWIKSNVAASYIGMLVVLFFIAHLWEPILYLWYALFAFGTIYFITPYVKAQFNKLFTKDDN